MLKWKKRPQGGKRMIPKRTKETDISSDIAQGKRFKKQLTTLVEEVTNQFMNGESLNKAIAKVAERENFSQVQIQRLVEEANTIGYNKKYNTVKGTNDRRISFELAELASIVELMGDKAPAKIENPNWVTGKAGVGSIEKKASTIEAGYLHTPNSHVDKMRDKMNQKQAAMEKKAAEQLLKESQRKVDEGLFKLASSLVRTEHIYKTANTIYNTLLSDVTLNDDLTAGIEKKATEISQHMAKTRRALPDFVVSLKVNPVEKIANTLLGQHSLIGDPTTGKTEIPKVAPTSGIGQYQQLIDIAKAIQKEQEVANAQKQLLSNQVPKEAQ